MRKLKVAIVGIPPEETSVIEPIITHHFDADEFQPAFDLMESGQSGKVILNWSA